MKGFSAFIDEKTKGWGSQNQFLKIPAYLETCQARFPGAQGTQFTLNSLGGC